MFRVLTLSTLFPNRTQPTLGTFVERQTRGLAALPDVAVEVVAPVGVPPWPLSRHPHYAATAALPVEEEWNGLHVHRPRYRVLPRIGARFTARWMAEALLPLLRDIRTRFPFDVIDAEFFWPDGPAARRAAAALGVPFSVKARGADIGYWPKQPAIGPQILAAAEAAGGLLAVSESLKREMVALGMSGTKIAVHYTGVDLDRFAPQGRDRAKAALGLTGPVIATVGALIPRKGQTLSIEALTTVPDATLVLAGDGPDRAMLQSLAKRLRVEERVRFLGAVPHDRVAQLLAAADVMLLPTRSEGLANAWVESLASGTPVITSDIAPAREAIPAGAGRLVPLDPAAIAAALRGLLADPPPASMLRQAAERFSWDRNATELRDHLRRIASLRPEA